MAVRENHRFEVPPPLHDEEEADNADQGRRQPQTFEEMQRGIAPQGNHEDNSNQDRENLRQNERQQQIDQKQKLLDIAITEQLEIVSLFSSWKLKVLKRFLIISLYFFIVLTMIVPSLHLAAVTKNIVILSIMFVWQITMIIFLIALFRKVQSSESYKQKQREINNIENEIRALKNSLDE